MTQEECLEKYIKLVYFFSNHLPSERQEDAVQEGILALLKCNENFDEGRGTQFTTFAFPHIRKAIMYDIKEHKWRKNSTTEFDEKIHGELTDDSSFSIALQEAINQLNENEKQVIKLRYFDSERVDTIAERFNVSRQTINNWENSALSKLRASLFLNFEKRKK